MLMRGYPYSAAVKDKDLMDLRIWASSGNVKLVRAVLQRDLPDWHAERPGVGLEVRLLRRRGQRMCRLLEPLASPKLMGAINVP